MLQEEGVQFTDLPKDDKLADGEEAHVGSGWVQPTHSHPVTGRELKNRALQLAGCRVDVPVQSERVVLINKAEMMQQSFLVHGYRIRQIW